MQEERLHNGLYWWQNKYRFPTVSRPRRRNPGNIPPETYSPVFQIQDFFLRRSLASVPNPICSLPFHITIINRTQLSSACQLPSEIPSLEEMVRFIKVHGSVPMSTSTSHDRANPITITATSTAIKRFAKFSF